MGTTFSRPNNSQPQATETEPAFPEEDDGVVHHTDRTAGRLEKSGEESQTAIETNGSRLPGFTDEDVTAGQDQYVEAGASSPALDGVELTSPHSTTGKRKKKSKAKNKAKRVHSATQERFSDQDEPSASKVARTIEADVKSEAAAIRSLGSIRRLRTTTEGSTSSLPVVSSTAQAVQPSSAREDGELSDEEQTPVIPAPTLASVPVSTLPLPVVSTNIPAAPRATTNRPHRGGHGWKHKEYKDRDALSTGQSVPWPTMPPYLASSRSFVPETSSRSRPKDTQSGLNYEDEYTASIAPVASGSQPQPVTTPQSDPPWPVSSYAGNRSTQVNGYGRRSHYTSPTSNTAAPQNFPVPPAFFRQYNAETSRRSGPVPPDSTQTAGAGPSTVNMPRNKNRTAEWDDDVDMEDRDAERALKENDAIRLEQARRWAEEQSMRMNQTLDAAGLRELIRLLLQLTSWGVSTTDFTERGVRRDLLRAVHDVATVINPLQRPVSPPPPPPVDSLPTPPPPPPSPPAQASRRQSIASSVEMDIATPSPEVQPITVNPSPSVEPIALPSVLAGPPTALAPEMAANSAKRFNNQNGLDTVQAALELVQVPTPSSETVSEPRPASDVTLMRAKLLAHKLRKQKEIKDRLRKLQAASTPTEISPEPLPNTNLPVPQPPSSETSASEAGSSFPSGERQANLVDVSPVQPLKVMLPKTPDLDNQTPIVTDSSQFFPVRAKAFGRGRKALAPAHPKSFIIDLDSDSDDDDAAAEQDRAVAVHQEAERLHAEHLKREIEKKEADRAALEAKIALMEARRQAKKAQAALPPLRQNKSVYHQTVTITATLPEPAALPRGEAIVQDLTPSNITPSERQELDQPALVEKITPAASNVLDSHATMTPLEETAAATAGGSHDPASHTTSDMNIDHEHRSDETKDMDKVVISSSPLVASIPLFPDETDLEALAALKPEPEQNISHGQAIERNNRSMLKSARDAFDPVMLSEGEKAPRFAPYTPLLNTIPVATQQPVKMKTRRSIAAPPISFSDATGRLDRSVLDSIIWTRIAQSKPDAIVCVYETEGGTCSDTSCEHIHLSRDIIPTHEDLLRLVSIVVPASSPAHPTLQTAASSIFVGPNVKSKKVASVKKRKGTSTIKQKKIKASSKPGETATENEVAGSSSTPASDPAFANARTAAVEDFLQDVQRAISVAAEAA